MGVTNQQTSLGGHHLKPCMHPFFLENCMILTRMGDISDQWMLIMMVNDMYHLPRSLDPGTGSMAYDHPRMGIKMSPPLMDLRPKKAPQNKRRFRRIYCS